MVLYIAFNNVIQVFVFKWLHYENKYKLILNDTKSANVNLILKDILK